ALRRSEHRPGRGLHRRRRRAGAGARRCSACGCDHRLRGRAALVGGHPDRPLRRRGGEPAPRRPHRDRRRRLPHSGRAGPRPRAARVDRGSEARMKLDVNIVGDLARIMEAEARAGEKAVTTAMRDAGTGLKSAWRAQITGAGLGARLARTIRSEQFPKGRPSLNAAALVWSNAPVIVGAHDTGPLIRARNGLWLAIPMPAAGKSLRGGRISPGEWERRRGLRLRFIYRRTSPSLLVAEGRLDSKGRAVVSRAKSGRGRATVPVFLLVPQVKLPKRLDLARDARRAHDMIPGLIVANWMERRLR